MIKFDIQNRWSGKAQFTAEIDCDGGVVTSIKLGLAVKWAVENDANLRGTDLRGADLSDADLSGIDLSGANLRGADLRGADLSGADLSGTDLSGTDLRGAKRYRGDLKNDQNAYNPSIRKQPRL